MSKSAQSEVHIRGPFVNHSPSTIGDKLEQLTFENLTKGNAVKGIDKRTHKDGTVSYRARVRIKGHPVLIQLSVHLIQLFNIY